MKLVIALLAFTACTRDLQDPAARAKQAIEKVRSQKSYRTEFRATIQAPNSDPMEIAGEGVWVSGGVLFIHYRASGGDVKRIVRVGDKAWVYFEPGEDWATADELGMGGAGRGVQNPDEVLGVLAKHLGLAQAEGADDVAVTLAGTDIEKVMKDQATQGSFDWRNSSAAARMTLAGDGTITRMRSEASLASTDPALQGKRVRYDADVRVVGYNDRFGMAFYVEDAKKKKTPVPIGADPLVAIAERPGIPKELADEISKLIDESIARCIRELADPVKREFAEIDLKKFGKRAVPALTRALEDKSVSAPARAILDVIAK